MTPFAAIIMIDAGTVVNSLGKFGSLVNRGGSTESGAATTESATSTESAPPQRTRAQGVTFSAVTPRQSSVRNGYAGR
jgi:hypothetical protein